MMGYIWTGMLALSLLCGLFSGQGGDLGTAITEGAQNGITLIFSIAGSICLWCGVGKLMEKSGITRFLSRLLRPLLNLVFPASRTDPELAGSLSANICANFLGLGNAATPMGIQAARRLAGGSHHANDQLCRLIVLNTASIQLIPATVAGVRAALGCRTPFDILPAVWITSVCSAGLGLISACTLGAVWKK